MWQNSRCKGLIVPQRKNTEDVCRIAVSDKLWQSEYGSASIREISTVTHCHLMKGFVIVTRSSVMYLPDSLRCIATNSKVSEISEEEEAKDPEEVEKEGCTKTTAKDRS